MKIQLKEYFSKIGTPELKEKWGKKPFTCLVCNAHLKTQSGIYRHLDNKHNLQLDI